MGFHIDKEYLRQRDWADSYHGEILSIVDKHLGGCPSDIVSDTKHGEDYVVCGNVGIAARVRDGVRLDNRYLDQATLRFTVGREQEFKKLLFGNFKATYYFYGVGDPKTGRIFRWALMRIGVLRSFFLQGAPWLTMGRAADELYFGTNRDKDGNAVGNGFVAYDIGAVRTQRPDLVVAASEGHYLPKDDRVRRDQFLPMAPTVALRYYESLSVAGPLRRVEGKDDWLGLGDIPFPRDEQARAFGRRILALCDVRLSGKKETRYAKKAVHLVLSCMRDHGLPIDLDNDRMNFDFRVVKAMVDWLSARKISSPSLRDLAEAMSPKTFSLDGRKTSREKEFRKALESVNGMLCDGV